MRPLEQAGAAISRLEAADNVDLATVLREYEAYYEFKLGKKPKLVRKATSFPQSPPLIRPFPSFIPIPNRL